jgi:hypothetical protein
LRSAHAATVLWHIYNPLSIKIMINQDAIESELAEGRAVTELGLVHVLLDSM